MINANIIHIQNFLNMEFHALKQENNLKTAGALVSERMDTFIRFANGIVRVRNAIKSFILVAK